MAGKGTATAGARETAEILALRAFGWLAADGDRLGAFMAETGTGPSDLAGLAGRAEGLAAVLDHLLSDEPRLLACAAALDEPPGAFAPARAALPGGDLPHWT